MPGKDIPGVALGPDGEGLCKVHARCASNAFLTLLLAGRGLDAEEALGVPLLVDYADPTAHLPLADRLELVDSYLLGDAQVTADEKSAVVTATVQTRCRVEGSPPAVVEDRGEQKLTLDLREEDGVWKLVRPLDRQVVRVDVFLRHTSNAALAEQVRAKCLGPEAG